MSGPGTSLVKAQNDATNAAQYVLQGTITPATAQLTVNAAEIVYFRAVVKACLANGCSPSAAMVALKSLGVTGL
jgi:hypothetical protein